MLSLRSLQHLRQQNPLVCIGRQKQKEVTRFRMSPWYFVVVELNEIEPTPP
jgi:hypothetical protein